ncbi:hypothetical protein VD0002_g9499 [Verticillium dahliae]|nr:3-dehydroshikimate dehydratase [Verticillium dahliae VDG2]PNH27962.1 hypothetical protein BJF96_g8733 [Verticillium dahliae]PNH41978.1 hypothetical protein VD0004_g5241 [Verticillium dahliae]PNH49497.1 hypothetical protein VD0003_g7655 [Verticillium dahliae]PNH58025.1 hypothetical protein VD0002_g9499 [Verticillium dahliae]
MTDFQSPASGDFPQNQGRDRAGSLSVGNSAAPPQPSASHNGGQAPPENAGNGNGPLPPKPSTLQGKEAPVQVQTVLASEIGVSTMLNQLKASIASAKEFALFLKKRSAIEETHASSLKKLSRMSHDTMHLPDHKQGTFAQAYTEMMYIHERMAENGMQFALSLHQMHDDLVELAAVAERSRKGWKVNGLAPEQRVAELETVLRKSKAKYDSLADEYDRARTGDTSRQSGKMFSLKSKSGPQHEEDLLRKVQGADQDYHGKVQHLQSEKHELVTRTRPEAIRALRDLVTETDSGVTLQMQKFASFNEKLLLSNGLSISPIKNGQESSGARSLREAVMAIDNDRDVNDYVAGQQNRLPPSSGEIKYERHPVLSPQQAPNSQQSQGPPPSQYGGPPAGQGHQQAPAPGRTSTFQQAGPPGAGPGGVSGASLGQGFPPGAGPPPPSSGQQQSGSAHGRSFSQGNMLSQGNDAQQQQQSFQQPSRNSALPASKFNSPTNSQGPPQLGALSFQNSPQQPPRQQSPPLQQQAQMSSSPHQQSSSQWQQPGHNPLQQHPPSGPASQGSGHGLPGPLQQPAPPQNRQSPPAQAGSMPTRPVFGLSLDRLYERDGLAVPMVVYQCIQAVDLFGLGVEGIYRQSGSLNHINKLKNMFDTDSSNPALDFRNPENFYHDVNSVTGLLKQFLRDLSDPLLTMEQHGALIEAAKHADDIVRRDSLHAIINSLPDPNYATLRALALHLHRVMDNSHVNRMNCHNLAVIFGPTLMGTDPSTAIADAGWQIKAIDTILQNTYQIFDED